MDIKDLENLYTTRQSCRSFSDKAVENQKLEKIIELARLSPSACNSQPWSFDVINSPVLSTEIAKATQDMGMNKFTSNCPSFIVINEEKATLSETVGMKFKDQDFVSNDIGIATAHIVLAAEVMGLSTCILGWINEKKIKQLINIPKNKKIRLVIAVGYAKDDYKIREKRRKPIDDIVRYHF